MGETSGSHSSTSSPELRATPFAQSSTSLSASASQKWFSPRRRSTGSFTMPPSSAVMRTYLPCPTAHLERSRGVSRLVNSKASGPVISTCRSTLTSHTVTPVSSFSYSARRSSYRVGRNMWL